MRVLILVLMEDTLRDSSSSHYRINPVVLILVLMEDTLRVRPQERYTSQMLSLNPCFNGRYSQS